jgi:hypothetical protein
MRPEVHTPMNTPAGELWKELKFLHSWTEIANAFDIALGFFLSV